MADHHSYYHHQFATHVVADPEHDENDDAASSEMKQGNLVAMTTGNPRKRGPDQPLSEDHQENGIDTASSKTENGADDVVSCKRTHFQQESDDRPRTGYWLAMEIVPAGVQDRDAGRDQTPIMHFGLVLGQMQTVIARKSLYVRPLSFVRLNQGVTSCASDEICPVSQAALDALSVDAPFVASFWSNQPTLPNALEQILDWCAVECGSKDALPLIVTSGHLGMRNVLHREMSHRQQRIDPAVYGYPIWYRYLDIATIVTQRYGLKMHQGQQIFKPQRAYTSDVEDCALAMGLTLPAKPENSEDNAAVLHRVNRLAFVLQEVLTLNGTVLNDPLVISSEYVPRTLSRNLPVPSDCIMEVRQVPWTATPSTIATFFAGLNIQPGGVAIRLNDGRRSNTAIVWFEDTCQAKMAGARHQHQLPSSALITSTTVKTAASNNSAQTQEINEMTRTGHIVDDLVNAQMQRITTLQVFPSSSKDFIQCAGCDIPAVTEFLSQLTCGRQVVVRIRGLPYTATKEKVMKFFEEANAQVLNNRPESIYFISYSDKRPTGDAFILFESDGMANRALTRHKDYIGDRYVELFKASSSEMAQVCHNIVNYNSASGLVNNGALPVATGGGLLFKLPTVAGPPPLTMLPAQMNFSTDDLVDPTDPSCPFAKPLPMGGATGLVQISSLPLDTTRHQLRLFLGPANYSKIYRMRRMESGSEIMTGSSTWLLSLGTTGEALALIRDLVTRSFTLMANPLARNCQPQFALFGVNPNEGQLYSICLVDPSFDIPTNCVNMSSMGPLMQKQPAATVPKPRPQPAATLPAATTGSQMIIVQGAPLDANVTEFLGFFSVVANMLTMPPLVQLIAANPNGTGNFLLTFMSPLEAQAAIATCSNVMLCKGITYPVQCVLYPPLTAANHSAAQHPQQQQQQGPIPGPMGQQYPMRLASAVTAPASCNPLEMMALQGYGQTGLGASNAQMANLGLCDPSSNPLFAAAAAQFNLAQF